jgi:hypothetical protein
MRLLITVFAAAALTAAIFTHGRVGVSSSAKEVTQRPRPSPIPQEVGEGDVLRIDTDLVTLTATVTDARGRYVANLKRTDFAVYEDGAKQELAYFGTGDRVPVSLGILFD